MPLNVFSVVKSLNYVYEDGTQLWQVAKYWHNIITFYLLFYNHFVIRKKKMIYTVKAS